MGIITISRGSYSKGKEIAEKLAEELGYECTSRDIILEASEHFHVPEFKLIRAIHDAPSMLDRFKYGKEKYIAFIRETFLQHLQRNDVVYHGLAGHFLLQGVPNVFKVRIIANLEDRIKEEMARENISEKEARHLLVKDDEERRKWSLHIYGIDTNDPKLYDIVLHIDNLKVDDAVDILAGIARRPCFQKTPESEQILKDQLLAAKVRVALIEQYPNAKVACRDGEISVSVDAALSQTEQVQQRITDIAETFERVKKVNVGVVPIDLID